MLIIILTSILTVLLYYVLTKSHDYWEKRGVYYVKPCALFGNLAPIIFHKQSMAELLQTFYSKGKGKRYIGLYQFLSPTIIIRDPDLIKQIAVKDFDSFPEHNMFAPEESDPLWAKTLFAMPGGDEWRDIRGILSPSFTSKKLRTMFGLITQCAEQFVDHLASHYNLHGLNMQDAFTKVTNDIIATTAFGVSCDSCKNPSNEIFVMGKEASDPTGILTNLKFFVASVSPGLAKFLKVRFISKTISEFFRKIISETISVREKNNIVTPDMIHLMMEARKERLRQEDGHKTILTDDVITAQALVFFLAGFDTVSRAMSFTAHELALNPAIQDRLREEVDYTVKNGVVDYERLMGMKYLDMVVSEALRKWPPFAVTDRRCSKPVLIEPREPKEEIPLLLDCNIVCQIPIYSLHRDPTFFPDPEKFDPERFNDVNKQNIKPFSYIPFGVGPRSCIGSRFALLEVKIVIFYLLRNFEIFPVEKTQNPLILSKSNINPAPDDGFWLGVKPRI